MSSCPGEGTLRLLGTDALGEGTYAAIEQHVEGCPECQGGPGAARPSAPRSHSRLARPGAMAAHPGFRDPVRAGPRCDERGLPGHRDGPGSSGRPEDRSAQPSGSDAGILALAAAGCAKRSAVSSVRHPNVVPLYDYGEADGWFFLVLEYVPGGTSSSDWRNPCPPRVAAGLMETIARAVGYVHGHGLLHLDLKPSNILLDCGAETPLGPGDSQDLRFRPRVSASDDTDASETSLAGLRGTPSYMAPEQATASRADVGAAADIHALGAILYELLTGRPPFQGTSTLETLDQVRGQKPVPPRRLNPKIPRDLETIALKCLEKNPSRRYASAEALAGDLRRWLEGRPIQARPVSRFEHAWRWCRRQPAVAALAVALLTTFVASFVGLLAMLRRSEALRSCAEASYQVAVANYEVASQSLDEISSAIFDDAPKYGMGPRIGYERLQAAKLARSHGIALS